MATSESCWFYDQCNDIAKQNNKCETEDIQCIKLFKLEYLYSEALLPKNQFKRTLFYLDTNNADKDAFIRLSEIEKNIVDFVKNGQNLYIHSMITGNGKTSWAIRLLQAYLNKIWVGSPLTCRALFINVPRFLLALKDSISNQSDYVDHIKQYVLSADLIVWDEIATKSLTIYEHEHLLSLINARIDDGKSNIYTSNLASNELQEKLGDRLYSRIMGLSEEIVFTGQDKRGLKK